MKALAADEEQIRFWVRHVRLGVALCVVLPLIIVVETWLADPAGAAVRRTLLAAGVIVASLPLLLVPVPRLVQHPRGRLFFDVWEAAGIALVCGFSLLDGGARSPYVLFFFVLLAHAALAYPPAGMALAGTVVVAGFLAVGLLGDPVPAAHLAAGALSLVVGAGTCAFASYNHVRAYDRTAAYARRIAELAAHDGLTGCLNHRSFHERLAVECGVAGAGRPLALMVVDVDHFKSVNDTHGHPAGDEVLARVGRALATASRSGDAAGRLGGDEFALLMPGTSAEEARIAAERLCTEVRTAVGFGVTVSVGVAATERCGDPDGLLRAADTAVYEAKRGGRDRVAA